MFQNHLLQVLTMVAMEDPGRFTADNLRNEKMKVLDAIAGADRETRRAKQVVRRPVRRLPARRRACPPDSRTPTYAAVQLEVDNWRWQGVPFYLRSGQGAGEPVQRGDDPVPLPAAPDVPAAAGRDAAVQPAGARASSRTRGST